MSELIIKGKKSKEVSFTLGNFFVTSSYQKII